MKNNVDVDQFCNKYITLVKTEKDEIRRIYMTVPITYRSGQTNKSKKVMLLMFLQLGTD